MQTYNIDVYDKIGWTVSFTKKIQLVWYFLRLGMTHTLKELVYYEFNTVNKYYLCETYYMQNMDMIWQDILLPDS